MEVRMKPEKNEKPLDPPPVQDERQTPVPRNDPHAFDNCNGALDSRFEEILEIYALDPERWDGLQ
jgi:hypothetical protein